MTSHNEDYLTDYYVAGLHRYIFYFEECLFLCCPKESVRQSWPAEPRRSDNESHGMWCNDIEFGVSPSCRISTLFLPRGMKRDVDGYVMCTQWRSLSLRYLRYPTYSWETQIRCILFTCFSRIISQLCRPSLVVWINQSFCCLTYLTQAPRPTEHHERKTLNHVPRTQCCALNSIALLSAIQRF